ncbi:MAG: hypothetical protein RLZZ519_751 [Bacteroidota bacterium]|jgi:hypothetical protein
MRHKEHPNTSSNNKIGDLIRLVGYWVDALDALPADIQRRYSEMKYGEVAAGNWWVNLLADVLLKDATMADFIAQYGEIYLASSAYGAVPTAAANLTEALAEVLTAAGWKVKAFKIHRQGGFERTNYGALGESARRRAMRKRKLALTPDAVTALHGKCVLVMDDIRCTGMHEREIVTLFANEVALGALAFAYCIGFKDVANAAAEEQLNHVAIKNPSDLMPWFGESSDQPRLNARMLKFILLQRPDQLDLFLKEIGTAHALRLYHAALSADGYFDKPSFKIGFRFLEEWLFRSGEITSRASFTVRNQLENKIVVWNVANSAGSGFLCAETGRDLSSAVALYSRFKFGDVDAIVALAKALTEKMLDALEAGGSLREMFELAKIRGEFVSLTAPGVRNVVSASNFLMREVGLRVNVWLTENGLPTMIVRTLGRLSSGRANYAELTAKERGLREKTTQTIIPQSEYEAFPSHVIFLDDIEVTGNTANRAKERSLSAGARSFHSLFVFRVDPELARQDAGIEHRMNHFEVSRQLDASAGNLLRHTDYQPVQRMLRLLLQPDNRGLLPGFLQAYVADHVLMRLYLGAMGNDYLWIHAAHPGERGDYGRSLDLMKQELKSRGLLDSRGMPV